MQEAELLVPPQYRQDPLLRQLSHAPPRQLQLALPHRPQVPSLRAGQTIVRDLLQTGGAVQLAGGGDVHGLEPPGSDWSIIPSAAPHWSGSSQDLTFSERLQRLETQVVRTVWLKQDLVWFSFFVINISVYCRLQIRARM